MQTASGGTWSIFASGSGGASVVTAGGGGASQVGIAGEWYDDSFERRRLVMADPSLGADEALCDFPAPLALPADTFPPGSVRADGADLRFVDATGQVLRHELEVWDAGGAARVWVRFPKLPVPAAVHMYYDSPAQALDPAAVADVVKPAPATPNDDRTPLWLTAQAQVAAGTALRVGPEQQR